MEFLHANTKACSISTQNGNFISAEGKDVIVIGGGDTGTDCVGTSMRHGCKSLVQVEILPQPPMERAKDNPWPEWPKVYRLDYGQEEAAAKFGADPRVYLTTAKKFVGDDNGQVKEVHTVEIQWEKNDKGQFVPKEVPGTEKVRPAQLVLLAMGFLGPEQPLLEATRRRTRSRAPTSKRSTTNTPPTSKASSPPAMPPRPKPGRLGLQRRPRRRPRMRPLPDGSDRFALGRRRSLSQNRRTNLNALACNRANAFLVSIGDRRKLI